MPPLLLAGVGAAAGAAKNIAQAGQEGKDRQLAADTQRYSPWTGMQAQMPKRGNVMGDVLGGATSVASFGQQFQNQQPQPGAPPAPGASPLGMLGQPNPMQANNYDPSRMA